MYVHSLIKMKNVFCTREPRPWQLERGKEEQGEELGERPELWAKPDGVVELRNGAVRASPEPWLEDDSTQILSVPGLSLGLILVTLLYDYFLVVTALNIYTYREKMHNKNVFRRVPLAYVILLHA